MPCCCIENDIEVFAGDMRNFVVNMLLPAESSFIATATLLIKGNTVIQLPLSVLQSGNTATGTANWTVDLPAGTYPLFIQIASNDDKTTIQIGKIIVKPQIL